MGKVRERLAGGAKRLGTDTEFVDQRGEAEQGDTLRRRYRLLDVARRLLPDDKRLSACMRVPKFGAAGVKVMYDPARGSSSFRDLCRCARLSQRPGGP